jgi:hypothetical protein
MSSTLTKSFCSSVRDFTTSLGGETIRPKANRSKVHVKRSVLTYANVRQFMTMFVKRVVTVYSLKNLSSVVIQVIC